jgi:hypothetical protein
VHLMVASISFILRAYDRVFLWIRVRPAAMIRRSIKAGRSRSELQPVIVVGTGFGYLMHVRALRASGFEIPGIVGSEAKRVAERAAGYGHFSHLHRRENAFSATVDLALSAATPQEHARSHPAALIFGALDRELLALRTN